MKFAPKIVRLFMTLIRDFTNMEIARFRLIRAKGALMHQYSLGRLACLLFLVPGSAFGATFYTAKTGSDSNTCTEAQSESTPKLTIAGGIGCMSSGDTLIVKAGSYNEDMNSLPSGTAGAYTTIRAHPGDAVTINRSSGSTARAGLFISKSYIEIDGFIVTGSALYEGFKFASTEPGTHHMRIQNCEIYGADSNGILDGAGNTPGQGGYNEYYNNNIHDNGDSNFEHGLYTTSDNNKIWNNDFHGNSGYGINGWQSSASADNNDVQYNRIWDNGLSFSKGGITFSGSNNLIANNLVWDNGGGGIWANSGNANKIYNNTIYSNSGGGSGGGVTTVSATNTLVTNNILYANTNNITNLGRGTVFTSNLESNPSFANAAADDFHIQSGSPARDSGIALAEATDDFDRVPRPQGAGIDIGAFEYTGLAPPSPSPPPPSASTPQPPLSLSAL